MCLAPRARRSTCTASLLTSRIPCQAAVAATLETTRPVVDRCVALALTRRGASSRRERSDGCFDGIEGSEAPFIRLGTEHAEETLGSLNEAEVDEWPVVMPDVACSLSPGSETLERRDSTGMSLERSVGGGKAVRYWSSS
eukprot:6199412-Pleurochrysis_carterae.AAC.4